jgi:hypothetical protein
MRHVAGHEESNEDSSIPVTEERAGAGRVCFVVCPIGDAGSAVRKHADQVLKHLIEPAVADSDIGWSAQTRSPSPESSRVV